MPLEQHPTDPDKLVMRAGNYNYNLQKPWVGLTEVCIHAIWDKEFRGWISRDSMEQIYQAIEAKLKEKNT